MGTAPVLNSRQEHAAGSSMFLLQQLLLLQQLWTVMAKQKAVIAVSSELLLGRYIPWCCARGDGGKIKQRLARQG